MSINLSNIKWVWVVLGVVIAYVIAFGGTFCVLASFALYLRFRGTPDVTLLYEFTDNNVSILSVIFFAVGTLVGGLLAGRKAKADAVQNGLMVGLVTGITWFIGNALFGGGVSPLEFIVTVGGGWLGGKLSSGGDTAEILDDMAQSD